MAITYRGSICTHYMFPTPGANCFVLENSARSRCNVNILRCVMQFDTLSLSAGANQIMPIARAFKGVATASGGVVMAAKSAWDTAVNAPDAGVIIRLDPGFAGTVSSDIIVTGTVTAVSQEFTARMASAAEQQYTYDAGMYDLLDGGTMLLRPGELSAIVWKEATPVGGIAHLAIAWEEDQIDAGYTISGAVTLSSAPVTGAKVIVVTDLDRDLPAPQIEVLTTGAPGTWSKTLASGVKADAFVQYRNGETLYTDEGKPYLKKP